MLIQEVRFQRASRTAYTFVATTATVGTYHGRAERLKHQWLAWVDDGRPVSATTRQDAVRRAVQQAYNQEHGIDPQTISKAVTDILAFLRPNEQKAPSPNDGKRSRKRDKPLADIANMHGDDLERLIRTLEEEMNEAAADLRFEYAARLRDEIKDLKREMREAS